MNRTPARSRRSWAEGRWWDGARRDPFGLVVISVLAMWYLFMFVQVRSLRDPLQRYYNEQYWTSCTGTLRPLVLPYVVDARGSRALATSGSVVVLSPSKPGGAVRFQLSEAAVAAGATRIEFLRTRGPVWNACLALERHLHANRLAVPIRMSPQISAAVGIAVLALTVGLYRHRRAKRTLRRGQTLRGSELVTSMRFNRLKRADGIGFQIVERPSLLALVNGGSASLSVRLQEESSHFLLMGDTGSGKSSLIRQLLEQVERRNQAAIVYDPAIEFAPQFYRAERGDVILNPLDARMPYWSPGEEIQHRAEALGFAKALFPDDRRDNRFFIESPRKIFARLLSFRPTAQEIAHWLQRPSEIDRLLQGTELASMIDTAAPSQRAGVLASLSMIGDSFQLVPERGDTTCSWSAHAWAQRRQGWVFLTSTPQTIDRLRPLMTLWLDLLLMRLLAGGDPVWMFLDELPTLNKLPKLPEALALARKPNVRLVVGFQGRAQLEARYGTEAEAMVSQPATKVFLRTSEPRAAEWISKALGEIEHERLRESVNYDKYFPMAYYRKSHNYSLDRQTKQLVLASEIMGLANLTGYLKSENYVVPFRFRPNPMRPLQPGLVPRAGKADEWPERPAPSSGGHEDAAIVATGPGHRSRRQANVQRDISQRGRPSPTVERDPYFE
jgi:type IV secretory pathway TraG/TraD family ATPase VirD4